MKNQKTVVGQIPSLDSKNTLFTLHTNRLPLLDPPLSSAVIFSMLANIEQCVVSIKNKTYNTKQIYLAFILFEFFWLKWLCYVRNLYIKDKQLHVLLISSTLCHTVCKVRFPGAMAQYPGLFAGKDPESGCLLCKACCLSSKNIPALGASTACWGPAVYHKQGGYGASCILDVRCW